MISPARIFLLSPAHCNGRRARLLTVAHARSPLAQRLRSREGAPLGEVMSFLSGLYFRGKLAYARAFARPPDALAPMADAGTLVITASAGLSCPEAPVTLSTLRAAARVEISADNPRYRRPLAQSARALARHIGPACEVVLLGSIASPKYVDVLSAIFDSRLKFPAEFVGRGDMSRGALLLRCVAEGRELEYVPIVDAPRRGHRRPRRPSIGSPIMTAVD